ncbi:MAG: electron transfer flavoprotein subunit alpha/FixB family protein [Flavobacteriales bacterium]|nr:electron transfer flavoprotein subunit alpha/FixB family protein [Flavobacteriales bacterium]
MSVLVYTESDQGKFKKIALEATAYAHAVAQQLGTSVTAISIHGGDIAELGKHGASKVLQVSSASLEKFNAKAYADVIKQAAEKEEAKVIVLTSSANSKYLAPLLAIHLNASLGTNVVSVPESTSPFKVKSTAFTNKAFVVTELKANIKIIELAKNAYGIKENETSITSEDFSPQLTDGDFAIEVQSVDKATNEVTIADAEIVVSAGRGMKGPENWGMIEDLARVLGAATACSKPVSDLGWRPHSEHVGQTGKPVASNLYIAIGISGAIQHLAGINSSKVKVVINNDPEAPFFKAADYGIVGDAFEIVPKLTEKLKEFKANNA